MIIAKTDSSLLKSQNIYRQTPLHCATMMGHKKSLLVFITISYKVANWLVNQLVQQ